MKKTTLRTIPKPGERIHNKSSIPVKGNLYQESKLLFSFELLDFSMPYYNCSGMCDKGIKNCFEKLREYSRVTINELYSNRGNKGIRFHTINKKDVKDWPQYLAKNEELEDSFYQISFGKSKGRAHGVLIDNVFYLIWLDPHHYLYHDERFGPKHCFKDLETCCSVRDDNLREKSEQIEKLEKENQELYELLDAKTRPG